MIEFKTDQAPELMFTASGELKIIFSAQRVYAKQFDELPKGKELAVQVKEYRKKRSLDANALLWVMCDQIAQKIEASKEEVYKRFIIDYGVFEIIPLKAEVVESFKDKWQKNGLGWFCEDMEGCKIDGYKRVMVYFGSSSYDTKEMSRVLNQVIIEAQGLGIPTMTDAEIESLCKAYNKD